MPDAAARKPISPADQADKSEDDEDEDPINMRALAILAVLLAALLIGRAVYLLGNTCVGLRFPTISNVTELPKKWRGKSGAKGKRIVPETLGIDVGDDDEELGYGPSQFSAPSGIPIVFPLTGDSKFALTDQWAGDPQEAAVSNTHPFGAPLAERKHV
jgi:hypothetical protein